MIVVLSWFWKNDCLISFVLFFNTPEILEVLSFRKTNELNMKFHTGTNEVDNYLRKKVFDSSVFSLFTRESRKKTIFLLIFNLFLTSSNKIKIKYISLLFRHGLLIFILKKNSQKQTKQISIFISFFPVFLLFINFLSLSLFHTKTHINNQTNNQTSKH